jgi:hypothetical protein
MSDDLIARLAAVEAIVFQPQRAPVSLDDIDQALVAARKSDSAALAKLTAAVNELKAQIAGCVTKSALDSRLAGITQNITEVLGSVSADNLNEAERFTTDAVRAVKRDAERAVDISQQSVRTAQKSLLDYAARLGG